ncbi:MULTISPECIES: SLATT domain-containing protein [Cyanophyceae]|uniref:SLATT domain-containing protein n=1 Tax=Cyanophyceae TaxID=3028117 RepID=UPI0002A67515|nr:MULTISPECIES: SLATT domain-containing protein [Cyanophyceae]AFZ33477.1 hypothetical protein Glo7428_5090 [Gloeocapsa sp. PCC 7428]PPS41986.1 hypothetical protein B1A85_16085 [Chroococcidiopsis sp. TS-821]
MANNQEIVKEVLDLENNSRLVKTAHFNAAQTKQNLHKIIGLSIIIVNIIIFSPLLDLITPKYSAVSIKLLAIIGASLAGIQTLFNFQKEADMHLSAGNIYASIYHRIGMLLAKYRDGILTPANFVEESETLQQEYLKANKSFELCIPSNKDYECARNSLKKRS